MLQKLRQVYLHLLSESFDTDQICKGKRIVFALCNLIYVSFFPNKRNWNIWVIMEDCEANLMRTKLLMEQ